jgi:hypothetical protein
MIGEIHRLRDKSGETEKITINEVSWLRIAVLMKSVRLE